MPDAEALLPEASSVSQNRFHVDGNVDLISNHDAAAVHRVLPATTKVLTIDPGSP